jgi:hypothetical protein
MKPPLAFQEMKADSGTAIRHLNTQTLFFLLLLADKASMMKLRTHQLLEKAIGVCAK